MAWPAGFVYRLQKPRQIKAHVGVICSTPAHRLESLLTETKRVEVGRSRGCQRCPSGSMQLLPGPGDWRRFVKRV